MCRALACAFYKCARERLPVSVRVGILMAFSRSIFVYCSCFVVQSRSVFWSSAKSSPSVLHATGEGLSDDVELKLLSGCKPLFVAVVAVLDFVVQSVQSKLFDQCYSMEALFHYKLLS